MSLLMAYIMDRYNRNQRAGDRAELSQGILDASQQAAAPATPYQLSPDEQFGNEQLPGLLNAPVGLQQDPNNPLAQLDFYGRIANLPGAEAAALQGLGGTFNRAQGQQQFGQQLGQQQLQWMYEQQRAQQQLGYDRMREQQADFQNLSKQYQAEVKPYRERLEKANTIFNLIDRRGGVENMKGSDDIALIKTVMRMVSPEAVTEGDQATAEAAAGYFGIADTFIKNALGGGGLALPLRQQFLGTLQDYANQDSVNMQDIVSQAQVRRDLAQLPQGSIIRQGDLNQAAPDFMGLPGAVEPERITLDQLAAESDQQGAPAVMPQSRQAGTPPGGQRRTRRTQAQQRRIDAQNAQLEQAGLPPLPEGVEIDEIRRY